MSYVKVWVLQHPHLSTRHRGAPSRDGFTWDSLAGHTFAFHPESTARGNTPFPAQLRKVAYGHDAAGERAEQFVAQTQAAWHRTGPNALTRDIDGRPHLGLLAARMFSEIATLKDAAFEEEPSGDCGRSASVSTR